MLQKCVFVAKPWVLHFSAWFRVAKTVLGLCYIVHTLTDLRGMLEHPLDTPVSTEASDLHLSSVMPAEEDDYQKKLMQSIKCE